MLSIENVAKQLADYAELNFGSYEPKADTTLARGSLPRVIDYMKDFTEKSVSYLGILDERANLLLSNYDGDKKALREALLNVIKEYKEKFISEHKPKSS